MIKIVIVGGGSYTWGPIFMHDLFRHSDLEGVKVVLEDINPERLDLVHALGNKMIAELGSDAILEKTTSLEHALQDADFVVLAITTGGLEAMRSDLEIPEKYGIKQSVGDTIGPGGLIRALRNIPVVAEIGRSVKNICPDALFLNYTNPMSTLTRILVMGGVKVVGLCHEWMGVRGKLARLFGVEPDQIAARIAGINHLIWVTDLWAGGENVWDRLPDIAVKILAGEIDLDPDDSSVFADHGMVKARLFQIFGALPVAGDRHLAEFFPHFINSDTDWGQDYKFVLTSIEDRQGMELFAKTLIESVLRGDTPMAPILKELPSEDTADIIAAAVTGKPYFGILNLPNTGQIANLPSGVVVETTGTIDHSGAYAQAYGELPHGVGAVLERHVRNQEMTVRAALAGDRELALLVLLNDPLSSRLTVDQAAAMLEELLEANRRWLPNLFDWS